MPRFLHRLSPSFFEPLDAQGQQMVRFKSFRKASEAGKSKLVYDGEDFCNICFHPQSAFVFVGCFHGGVCKDCAYLIWEKKHNCHFCRAPIMCLLSYSVGRLESQRRLVVDELHQLSWRVPEGLL